MDAEDDRVRLAALRCWRQLLEALGGDLTVVTQSPEPPWHEGAGSITHAAQVRSLLPFAGLPFDLCDAHGARPHPGRPRRDRRRARHFRCANRLPTRTCARPLLTLSIPPCEPLWPTSVDTVRLPTRKGANGVSAATRTVGTQAAFGIGLRRGDLAQHMDTLLELFGQALAVATGGAAAAAPHGMRGE